MTTANAQLAALGLTTSEITVYRAGLAAPLTAGEIAKRTGIKRPTVYHAISTLMQKGLCAKSGTGLRLKFPMAAPETLERIIDHDIEKLSARKVALKKLIPLLAASDAETAGTTVEQYEGEEGIRTVIDAALYCRSRKWDIIAPGSNFFTEADPSFAKSFMAAREARGIITRSLWEKQPETRRRLTSEETKARNPRFLPKQLWGKFTSVVILFDDAVAIIAPKRQNTAVLIRSKDIHGTMAVMFEGLWLGSTPY